MEAREVMNRNVVTVSPDATLAEAVEIMIEKKVSGMPVVDAGGRIAGLISERDIIRIAFSRKLHQAKVKDVMVLDVESFPPNAEIELIAEAIGKGSIRRVPIVYKDRVVGIISRRDIIRIAEAIFGVYYI